MRTLRILGKVYSRVVDLKNFLYDNDYFCPVEIPVPVLSIGNLTVGGTGKTPLTDFCLKYYRRRQVNPVVVSKNYRAQVKDIAVVDPDIPGAAAYYGDEPVLLAEKNPLCKVYVGPRKFQTAKRAFENENPSLIIIDDGFQHRKLYRDVDFVVLDATESPLSYRSFPEGRARESFESLVRATAILVTKINLVSSADLEALVSSLQKKFTVPVFCFSYEITHLHLHGSQTDRDIRDFAKKPCLLVSGLAKPMSFEKSLSAFDLKILKHFSFPDHHPYSGKDIERIQTDWKEAGSPPIITTEKDYVKLRHFWPASMPLWILGIEVRIQNKEDSFYEILDQVLY